MSINTSVIHRLGPGIALLALCLGLVTTLAAQTDKRQLTLEWILGPEGRSVASLPSTTWLDDGTLIMLDNRRAAGQRTFERVSPVTGERRPLVDPTDVLPIFNSGSFGIKVDSLPWPIAFDGGGQQALYVFNGDVFVFHLAGNRLYRLTSTPAEETSASFSPNGRRVAYVRENDLYFYDLDKRREIRVTRDGSETLLNGTLSWVYWEEVFGRRDIGYWWAPDSNAVAYLQSDDSKVDLAYFTDIKPFSPRVIRQRYARAGRANPTVRLGIAEIPNDVTRPVDMKDNSIGASVRIRVKDRASLATTWINLKGKPFEYIVRAKWLPDGRRLSVQTMPRLQTELTLYFADRKTGATTRVLTETDPGWVNMNDDLYFYSDGRHFLWPSERDGYMHLYRYRIDGTLVNQVTHGKFALASAGGVAFWVRQAIVGVDEKNDWIYFTALERSSTERHLYRIHSDGSKFTLLSREPGTHRISMSPDTRHYLDRYSDIRTLPTLTLYPADLSLAHTLGQSRPELLTQFEVQFPELTTIPADDGFPMPAQILRPKSFDAGR